MLSSADHQRITAMTEGGKLLGQVKAGLVEFAQVGRSFEEIEAEAQRLIKERGATPSFSTVPGYSWATCLMKNHEMCHGIPQHKVVESGDVLKIDVGLMWQGYHLDTTTTVAVGPVTESVTEFLAIGQKALAKAINKARLGNSIYDISAGMQKVVERHGYSCVYQLCGHGIGKKLHDDPEVPCLAQRADKRKLLKEGQTLAIEIMYAMGDAYLELAKDGWTYVTADHSLAGMFEDTVLITEAGPQILTA